MQTTSALWKTLAGTGSAKMEVRAGMGNAVYPLLKTTVSRALCPSALSVGNCVSATVQFSLRPDGTAALPESSVAVLKCRLTDGQRASEWVDIGTFHVNRRQSDPVTGMLSFQGFDSMQMANAPFSSLAGFPKAMNSVVMEIAHSMGIAVDRRTWEQIPTGADYVVPLPSDRDTMQKVLGGIGGVCGGNWIITPQNQLRLVPFLSASDAETAYPDQRTGIVGITGRISVGNAVTVTGVSIGNDTHTFTAGTETGAVLTVPSNPYATQGIADRLLAQYGGLVYAPYTIESGIYDPAAEPGDYLISREDVRSILCQESASYGAAFRGNLSAPFPAESSDSGQSLSDRLDAVSSSISDMSVRVFRYANQEAVTIADGAQAETVIDMDYSAGAGQIVVFHGEVTHTMETTETWDNNGWLYGDGILSVYYRINRQLVEEYHPVQTEMDGPHTLDLTYTFENGHNTTGNFRAEIAVTGGTVSIAQGAARAYILGRGSASNPDGRSGDGLLFVCIESYPVKMEYRPDEWLDLTGLVVMAYYGDGTQSDVTADCEISPQDGAQLNAGTYTVEIVYTEEGKTFTDGFDIYVRPPVLLYIEVREPPVKYLYERGETLDYTGISVVAVYDDGSEMDVTDGCTFTPQDGTVINTEGGGSA